MRILFIAPRMHTNQNPIIKGLIDSDAKVGFAVYTSSKSEDHSMLEPSLIKKSVISNLVCRIIEKKNNDNSSETKKIRWYFPSFFWAVHFLKKFKPDVVVLRDRSKSSAVFYFICKLLKIKKVIIYNQHPVETKYNFAANLFFPKVRYTPVIESHFSYKQKTNQLVYNHSYFIPFVYNSIQVSNFWSRDKVGIIDVGKYRDYKNHYLVVDAVSILLKNGFKNFKLTIVGQVLNADEQHYFESLKKYVFDKNLGEYISLMKNIRYSMMDNMYKQNDILVLASKKEVAGMSIIEGMANGLCSISTDLNGTASYTGNISTINVFNHSDEKSLAEALSYYFKNPNILLENRKRSYEYICRHCSFEEYKNRLSNLLKEEFGYEWR